MVYTLHGSNVQALSLGLKILGHIFLLVIQGLKAKFVNSRISSSSSGSLLIGSTTAGGEGMMGRWQSSQTDSSSSSSSSQSGSLKRCDLFVVYAYRISSNERSGS